MQKIIFPVVFGNLFSLKIVLSLFFLNNGTYSRYGFIVGEFPSPGLRGGANRPWLSSTVHGFRSCRGRRASLRWRKNSNKSISNLIEASANRPEGWIAAF